jgi:hypothetical protein
MTTDPEALLRACAPMVEKYMESQPTCFLCHDWPAMAPMVYTAEATEAYRVRGAVFGLCIACLLDDDLPARITQALRMARAQRQGVWN